MAPSNQINNTGFFDGRLHHYYLEKLAFYALIKHMFKTGQQKNEITCTKDFIPVHMETVSLKCSQKN